MDEIKDFELNDMNDIRDDQERLYFKLSSLWENIKIDPQKVRNQSHELKLLQFILYFLIFSGIFAFFILVFMNIHFIIILIDVGVIAVYISYLKYITLKYRKILKISKKKYIKILRKGETFSTLQLIFYSFIIFLTFLILILSMIGIDPLILIVIISVSLLYVYFDTDIEDDNTSDI